MLGVIEKKGRGGGHSNPPGRGQLQKNFTGSDADAGPELQRPAEVFWIFFELVSSHICE